MLELLVVMALMAGLIAIAIPSIRSLGGLDIKNEMVKMAGLSSEVYALAAISGKTHRIVFDLEAQEYWVEEKTGDAGEINPELGYEELFKSKTQKKEKKPEDKFLPSFKEVEGSLHGHIKLHRNLVIHGVWTEDREDIARTGKVAIYYFSGGFTQTAFVSVAEKGDEEETSMYLTLNPLTAAITIELGEPEPKDLLPAESGQ